MPQFPLTTDGDHESQDKCLIDVLRMVARGVIQEVPQRTPNGMRGYGAPVEQQSEQGSPSRIRSRRMHKMKTVLFAGLMMVASLAALTPEMAQAHSHKVCHWDHHHHRVCHWVH
jgi:hypothetical protein